MTLLVIIVSFQVKLVKDLDVMENLSFAVLHLIIVAVEQLLK